MPGVDVAPKTRPTAASMHDRKCSWHAWVFRKRVRLHRGRKIHGLPTFTV